MNKKKKTIIVAISIMIIILLFVLIFMNNSIDDNTKNTTIKDSNTNEKNTENNSQILNEQTDTVSKNNNTLPSDDGLTVSGVSKTFNQDIISQANIAYLLGCENITDKTNFEDYINKNNIENGIYISKVTGYTKSSQYDFIKENNVTMKENLSKINLTYDIDSNNYLIDNKSTNELDRKINKLISGDKKIIIGFLPEYYVYINDMENGLSFGGYDNSSYVSLKPYNNIYTFIFDFNSDNTDDFFNMIENIAELAD